MIQEPGFTNPVQAAQQTFRALLVALANPGKIETLKVDIHPPEGLSRSCGAACLTLLDLETRLWLQPSINQNIQDWLVFHAGCRLVSQPALADFAVILDSQELPSLDTFCWGTPEDPETSTTVLIQLERLTGGTVKQLRGPGILETRSLSVPMPNQFWADWQLNHQSYPLGVDSYCFAENHLVGLPRSVEVH